jgi:hypothetical protein
VHLLRQNDNTGFPTPRLENTAKNAGTEFRKGSARFSEGARMEHDGERKRTRSQNANNMELRRFPEVPERSQHRACGQRGMRRRLALPIVRSGVERGGSGRWAGEGFVDVCTRPSRQLSLQPSSLHAALSSNMRVTT